jgi:hypothetical protein
MSKHAGNQGQGMLRAAELQETGRKSGAFAGLMLCVPCSKCPTVRRALALCTSITGYTLQAVVINMSCTLQASPYQWDLSITCAGCQVCPLADQQPGCGDPLSFAGVVQRCDTQHTRHMQHISVALYVHVSRCCGGAVLWEAAHRMPHHRPQYLAIGSCAQHPLPHLPAHQAWQPCLQPTGTHDNRPSNLSRHQHSPPVKLCASTAPKSAPASSSSCTMSLAPKQAACNTDSTHGT